MKIHVEVKQPEAREVKFSELSPEDIFIHHHLSSDTVYIKIFTLDVGKTLDDVVLANAVHVPSGVLVRIPNDDVVVIPREANLKVMV